MSKSIILIGGSGHARVIIDCIRSSGREVFGILDDGLEAGTRILDVPVLGQTADYEKYREHEYLIAIGNNAVRRRIAERMGDVQWAVVIHPAAVVSSYAQVQAGTVVMPRAVVNAGAEIGRHCIINTGAIVEHDNKIADYVHLSPAVALGGTVSVGAGTHVGIGALVRNNISICEECTIGAGAAVVKHITEPGVYVGVPAGRIR